MSGSVFDIVAKWAAAAEKADYRPEGALALNSLKAIRQHLPAMRAMWSNLPLAEATLERLQADLDRHTNGDADRKPAPMLARAYKSHLSSAFAWGRVNKCAAIPGIDINLLRTKTVGKRDVVLQPEQQQKIFGWIDAYWRRTNRPESHDAAVCVIELALLTGRQKKDCAEIRTDGFLPSLSDYDRILLDPQNEMGGTLPVPHEAVAIRTVLDRAIKLRGDSQSDLLFPQFLPRRRGNPLTLSRINKVWDDIVAQTALADDNETIKPTINDLRHSYVLNGYRRGVDTNSLSKLLGMRTIEMVTERYINLQADDLAAYQNTVQKLFDAARDGDYNNVVVKPLLVTPTTFHAFAARCEAENLTPDELMLKLLA